MKMPVLVLGGVVAIALFSTTLPCGNRVLAISGCCKERQTLNQPWRTNGKNLNQCKAQNEIDRDNVFDMSGLVWWDAKCR